MQLSEKRDLMINVFKNQFAGIPEDLRELKAKKCLAFAIKLQTTIFQELTKEESEIFVEKITTQIENNKKLFGENAKRLMPNHKFVGQQAEEFVVLLKKGLLKLIEEQKLAIIQTPISLCMHDLSKPEELACQRGFNFNEIILNGPAPSRCKGANCSNSLFFEEHIEKLKKEMYGNIDPELKSRLEKNTFFLEAGGFEQDPFKRIIKEYDQYKEMEKISG